MGSLKWRLAALEAVERRKRAARTRAVSERIVDRSETDAEFRVDLAAMVAFTDRMGEDDPPLSWEPEPELFEAIVASAERDGDNVTTDEIRRHLWHEVRTREYPEYLAILERVSARCRDILGGHRVA